jgi:hypothetical protein
VTTARGIDSHRTRKNKHIARPSEPINQDNLIYNRSAHDLDHIEVANLNNSMINMDN